MFVGATLLFVVQPMVGKMILPLLGGTPAVWSTCMVFFQAALLAGYAYAHASASRFAVGRCGIGSCGVPRPSLADYVMETGDPEGGNRCRRGLVLTILSSFFTRSSTGARTEPEWTRGFDRGTGTSEVGCIA
jgi:hypothetical protein